MVLHHRLANYGFVIYRPGAYLGRLGFGKPYYSGLIVLISPAVFHHPRSQKNPGGIACLKHKTAF